MKKRLLSVLLALCMVCTLLPTVAFAAAADHAIKMELVKDTTTFSGKAVLRVDFMYKSGSEDVPNNQMVYLKYDASKLAPLYAADGSDASSDLEGLSDFSTDCGVNLTANNFVSTGIGKSTEVIGYSWITGGYGYLCWKVTEKGNTTIFANYTRVSSIFFGLEGDTTFDALPSNAISFSDRTEDFGITSAVNTATVTYNGSTTIFYGSAGENLLAAPTIVAGEGVTLVKPAYTGTQASKPTVYSKVGGSVMLTANAAITGETVEYAYNTSATAPTSGWQDKTLITGLAAGTYYFFARVKESAGHLAGNAVVSDAVSVYAAPTISYTAPASMTYNTAITEMTPTVTAGAGLQETNPYALTGTLPAGLSFDPSTGKISGTPTGMSEAVTVTVEVTDKEYRTGDTEISFPAVGKAVGTLVISPISEVTYGSAGVTHGTPTTNTSGATVTYTYSKTSDGTYAAWNAANGVGTWYAKGHTDATANYNAADSVPVEFQVVGANIGGTVTIDNTTPAWGETLTAVVTEITPEAARADLTYQWYRGADAIEGKTGATYTVVTADIGKTLKVTVTGAGNYDGSMPSAATSVVAKKAAPTDVAKTYEVYYLNTEGQTVAVADFNLPIGLTGAAFSGTAGSKTTDYGIVAASYSNTMFALNSGLALEKVGSSDAWTVTISSDNYADITATVTVTAINKTGRTITGASAATDLVYNGTAKAGYTGTVVVEGGSVPVNELVYTYSGTLNDGSSTAYGPTAAAPTQAGSYKLVISIADTNATYMGASADINFTIGKQPVTITGVQATARDYASGNTTVALTGGTLNGTLVADNVSFTLGSGTMADANAGTDKSVTTAIALDGDKAFNYTLTQPTDVKVIINRVDPTYAAPTNLTATYGQTLADVAIASGNGTGVGTWGWDTDENATTTSVGTPATRSFKAKFMPTDATNYNTVNDVSVNVVVSPADYTVTVATTQNITVGSGLSAITVDDDVKGEGVDGEDVAGTLKWYDNDSYTTLAEDISLSTLSLGGYQLLRWEFIASDSNYVNTGKRGSTGFTAVAGDPQTLTFSGVSGGTVTETYGDAKFTFAASNNRDDGGTITYTSSATGVATVDSATGEVTIVGAGTATITAKAAAVSGKYAEGTASYTLNVNTKPITVTGVSAADKAYDGGTAATITGTASVGTLTNASLVTSGASAAFADKNVGEDKTVTFSGYTLTGTGAGNYSLSQPASVTADITAKELNVTGATLTGRDYNGATDVEVTAVTLSGVVDTEAVSVKTGTGGVTGTISSANAGSYTSVDLANIALDGADKDNYSIEAAKDDVTTTVTIDKATWGGTLSDQDISWKYTVTGEKSADFPTGLPGDRGTTAYDVGTVINTDYVLNGTLTVNADTGEVTYTLAGKTTYTAGQTATIPVVVTMQNYEDVTVDFVITLTDKDVPVLTADNLTITYTGSDIPVTAVTGKTAKFNGADVAGIWSWESTAPKNATPGSHYMLVFTPTDSDNYETAKLAITVTVNKKDPTGTPSYTAISAANKTLADAALAVGSITPAEGTIKWVDGSNAELPADTAVTANTYYKWLFTPTDSGNYNILTGSIKLYSVSTGGGGGVSTYPVTVTAATGGTITVSPEDASRGTIVTVTIKTDEGYTLDTLSATDRSGKTVELTKKSDDAYTFMMPGSGVTVAGTFKKAESPVNPFVDVTEPDWFYDDVMFTFVNGMMQGVSDDLFDVHGSTTRGMIVTVLYRMENEPDAVGNPFDDVENDKYYARAVAWAAANKIVNGYGPGRFGPEDHVTREQVATILYNYAVYKGYDVSVGENTNMLSFKDALDIHDWAMPAMQWACGTGLIRGYDGYLTPRGNAERCQIAAIFHRFCDVVQ